MDSSNTNKRMRNAIIGGVVLLLITIGATYAFFMVTNGTSSQTPINVTSNTTDSLIFNINKDISITANMSNFNSTNTGSTQSDNATATATLRANNKTNEVEKKYYLDLNVINNNFVYSINENTPELILRVKAPGTSSYLTASDVASMDGTLKKLKYIEDVVDKDDNHYAGFDITNFEGRIKIIDNKPIIVTEDNAEHQTIEQWEIEILFINYNNNQTENGGKTINAQILMRGEREILLSSYVINEYETNNSNIYYHDENLTNGANDNSYRYAGSSLSDLNIDKDISYGKATITKGECSSEYVEGEGLVEHCEPDTTTFESGSRYHSDYKYYLLNDYYVEYDSYKEALKTLVEKKM